MPWQNGGWKRFRDVISPDSLTGRFDFGHLLALIFQMHVKDRRGKPHLKKIFARVCTLFFLPALLLLALPLQAGFSEPAPKDDFKTYLTSLWPLAQKAGVSAKTFHDAFAGVQPDPEVLSLTRKQPEYNLSTGEYLARAVSPARIAKGRELMRKWTSALDNIEERFGVDRSIVVAFWGIETGYGAASGHKEVIRSIATLAYARYRRDDFYRDELIEALLILQSAGIDRTHLFGSWAGAMGQPQFLPSSYRKYAVDFDGDGRADIWTSVPDTLASIANYLKMNGWSRGLVWGMPIDLPKDCDLRQSRGSFAEWNERGATAAGAGRLPDFGQAILFHPSGYPGPAFLVTSNFDVIKTYNNSDPYALAVALVADGLKGLPQRTLSWPNRKPLGRDERIELQRRLADLGYSMNNFLGWMDFDLRDVVRKIQFENGMTPDGEPGKDLLAVVRKASADEGSRH